MVLTISIAGRRVAPAPISDHRTKPSASAAARSTFARSGVSFATAVLALVAEGACVLWARAEGSRSAATAAIVNVVRSVAFVGIPAPLHTCKLRRRVWQERSSDVL